MPNTVPMVTSKGFNKLITTNSGLTVLRGKQDRQAPQLSFVTPVNGATVADVQNIIISAKDNVGVDSLSISINGVQVSKTTSYTWQTKGLASGYYWLTAYAEDAAGNSRTISITVSIKTTVTEHPAFVSGVQITMPPVLNQGSEGSCVAFAVGYAARSVEYYNATGISKTFSPEYLYNQVKFSSDCYSGTSMQMALEFITNNGILPWGSMPYSSTNGCALQPTEVQKQEALVYKTDGFVKMYTVDTAMIKAMVRSNKPVVISIVTNSEFDNAKGYFIWKTPTNTFTIPHCVVICGYDDTKKAYRIMNSWGASWADAGYCWITYDMFLTRTGTYCYAIK